MIHASLCTGIGGFDLAADWMGWQNALQVEIDPFCQKVLRKNFPNTTRYADITTTDFAKWQHRIDILTAGIPCQPYSVAGLRGGADDDRAIWPHAFRAVRQIQPAWVVIENVPGIVELALDDILADLESVGYATQAYIIPACAQGALHIRDRVWIVAYSDRARRKQQQPAPLSDESGQSAGLSAAGASTAYALCLGREIGRYGAQEERKSPPSHESRNISGRLDLQAIALWQPDSYADILREAYGLPAGMDRRSGRNARIKALGNAIVPQVAFEIFQKIALCTPQQ